MFTASVTHKGTNGMGYTKHYFEGDTRVCSKIGGGFGNVRWTEVDTLAQTIDDVDYMYLH